MATQLEKMAAAAAAARTPRLDDVPTIVRALSIEPQKGPWTGNSEWGGRFQGPMPVDTGTILALTETPGFPGPPRSVGVTLFRAARGTQDARNADVYCQVTYGAGGVSNTFLMDWFQGGTFAIQANTLRIDAVTFAPNASAAYDPLKINGQIANLALGVTMGINGVAPVEPVGISLQSADVAAGASLSGEVPEFARAIIPYAAINTPIFPSVVITDFEINTRGITQTLQCYKWTETICAQGLRIPGSAVRWSVRNNSAVSVHMGVKFLLGL